MRQSELKEWRDLLLFNSTCTRKLTAVPAVRNQCFCDIALLIVAMVKDNSNWPGLACHFL